MAQPGSLIDQVLDRLDIAAFYRKELPGLKNGRGDEAIAFCPFHDDRNTPNLSVNLKTGLYHCFACGAKGNIFTFYQNRHGCDLKAALHDLAKLAGIDRKQAKSPKRSFTLQEFSSAKRLPVDFLKNHGVSEFTSKDGNIEVRFHYLDENKTLISSRRRIAKTGDKFRWRKGNKVLVYGLWELEAIRQTGWCLLLEGESDLLSAWFYKIPALAIPGKGTWRPEWAKYFEGLQVYLWQEPDAPELPGKVAKDIPDLLVIQAPDGIKDISEAHLQGQDVGALIKKLKGEARPFVPEIRITKPEILITKRYLDHISDEAIKALETANHPPFLFIRSGSLVRVSSDEKDTPKIVALNDVHLRGILARHAFFIRVSDKGPAPTSPPMDVVKDILSLGKWSFPALEGIIQAPAMRLDGTVLNQSGYDPKTGLYYVNPPDLLVPTIPENPSKEDLKEALGYLLEIIFDFPFVEDADRANALGLILTLPLRPAIPGNVPMAAITAPAPGTGKSLLTEVVALLGTGKVAPMAGLPRDDDEMRKAITSRLLAGDPLIAFDNLELPLWGPSLSRALTCSEWEDRILGKNLTVRLPQRAAWIANGNNLKLRGDLPRRTFPIRLDAKISKPWHRENFRHKNLREWVSIYRGDFLAAILTLGRAWFVAGKPEPKNPIPVLGGFEGWSKTVAGILSFAGVDGFLANLKQFHDEADLEGPEWEGFLSAWVEAIGESAKTCKEVEAILRANPQFASTLPDKLEDVLKDPDKTFAKSLGRALAGKEKRPYGDKNLALQRDRVTSDKIILWKVAPL